LATRGYCIVLALSLACVGRSEVPYGACNASSLCAEETPRCVSFRNRLDGAAIQLCTRACARNDDCPGGGVCVPTETTGLNALCLQRCALASQCLFTPAICPVVRAGDNACLP
jgi:hypothetical protein